MPKRKKKKINIAVSNEASKHVCLLDIQLNWAGMYVHEVRALENQRHPHDRKAVLRSSKLLEMFCGVLLEL
jgi:hypothetical protein